MIIKCKNCDYEIELDEVLADDIKSSLIAAEHKKHEAEIEKLKKENEESKEALVKNIREKAEAEATSKLELKFKTLSEEAEESKKDNKELQNQLLGLTKELRESRKKTEGVELEMQKKLNEEEVKIREEVAKSTDEKYRMKLAEQEKKLADTQKALDEAQRKASPTSQQLQGEVMELDFEKILADEFRDDDIAPVAKGTSGGDILHTVKSPRGTVCGVMLWEIKRTKVWTDGWIAKLKGDLRSEKANIPIIVTEVMPKQLTVEMGNLLGVRVCTPRMAVVLATLLRKSLLDAGLQKALAENRGTKADALYNFVTSHEFIQEIESMVETYQEMTVQITKERAYYTKFWSEREAQAQRLLLGTAKVVGSMQGHIGPTSMPKIKGLELLDAGEEVLTLPE